MVKTGRLKQSGPAASNSLNSLSKTKASNSTSVKTLMKDRNENVFTVSELVMYEKPASNSLGVL